MPTLWKPCTHDPITQPQNNCRCDDRIVSLSQPQARPIIRGKQSKSVEFGAKLSVSLSGQGLARVDRLCWDAFHEGLDLKAQVIM